MPMAWNNLGAVEYLEGQNGSAISDYKRAIKLNKKSAHLSLQSGDGVLSDEGL